MATDHPGSIVDKSARVMEMIAAYRNRGHLMADIDPLRGQTGSGVTRTSKCTPTA